MAQPGAPGGVHEGALLRFRPLGGVREQERPLDPLEGVLRRGDVGRIGRTLPVHGRVLRRCRFWPINGVAALSETVRFRPGPGTLSEKQLSRLSDAGQVPGTLFG